MHITLKRIRFSISPISSPFTLALFQRHGISTLFEAVMASVPAAVYLGQFSGAALIPSIHASLSLSLLNSALFPS